MNPLLTDDEKMVHYDIFNGDADGLCALVQMRLDQPLESITITGVKRDICLFEKLELSEGDSVLAMDISLARNHNLVQEALELGVSITWIDHHLPGEPISHDSLIAHIDMAPDVCTSVIVDGLLEGRQRAWAVVAAFGDAMRKTGLELCKLCDMQEHIEELEKLGRLLNYNSYGRSVDDLWLDPADLFRLLLSAKDPLTFIGNDAFKLLERGYQSDLENARKFQYSSEETGVIILPNEPWAFRISGTIAHLVADEDPDIPHVIVTQLDGEYSRISLRAPANDPNGAGELCAVFGGGGRAAAGGVDSLPSGIVADFISAVHARWT